MLPSVPQVATFPWFTRTHTIRRMVQVDLRRVAIRALLWGLAFALILAIPFLFYFRSEAHAFKDAHEAEKYRVIRLASEIAPRELSYALSDVRYLSQINEMRAFLAADTAANRHALAREFLGLAAQKGLYDQVRFIDAEGRERVRVNHAGGRPVIVPDLELHYRGERPYFRESIGLPANQIYVSPFDLNSDSGQLEIPLNPVIRLAMPITGVDGRTRGILVLNYLGQRLLDELANIGGEPGSLWLLDARGYWMLGPTREDAWGWQVPSRETRNLAAQDPELWRHISERQVGTYSKQGDWIQFERIHPLAAGQILAQNGYAKPVGASDYYWTIATVLPGTTLDAGYANLRRDLGIIYGAWTLFGFLLAGGLSFLGGRSASLAQVMESVIDNLPVLIAYVDGEERYRFNNMAYLHYFGRSPNELFGSSLRELVGEDTYLQFQPHVKRALNGEVASFELRMPYPEAGVRDVAISFIPDIRTDARTHGFYMLVNDVSPIKESERRERQRMLELAHVSRLASLGEMASEIAHEINQPLAAVSMYSAAGLRTLGPERGQMHDWLEAINAQAKRAGEVVRHLRRFVRKGEIQPGPVDLNQVARDVAALIRIDADRQDATVDLQLAPDLPSLSAELILVEQVLFNLLRNALEAMAGEAGEKRIQVRTFAGEEMVCVEVQDTGPGVSSALGARIFESFTTDKQNGLGMGLAISRSIVEAHGGTLSYVNPPQGGATFRCCLPREISHEQ